MSQKDCLGFLGLSCFLRTLLSSFCVQSKFWFVQKAWSPRCPWAYHVYLTLVLSLTGLPRMWVPRDFLLTGITDATCEWGSSGGGVHTMSPLPLGMLHCPTGLHSQNPSSKMKLVRFSKWRQQSVKQAWGPSESRFLGSITD